MKLSPDLSRSDIPSLNHAGNLFSLMTNGVVITDPIKFVQQKKEELNQMDSNKHISGEEETRKSIKEKEQVLDSDNVASTNTKNKTF